jgi:hypothetical protein
VITAAFLACMERILAIYARPYDPLHPVVCFDERPCFLIGERIDPVAMQTGEPAKEHYAYHKNGSAALLAAIEPQTGYRLGHVRAQRTKKEFALFMQELAAHFDQAETIYVVLDNLNTHNASSFYEHFEAVEARALSERIEFVYTPKSASWLNMIEIEFSALSRLCLKRRIGSMEELSSEVAAFFSERMAKGVRITWQFSIASARARMNRHYRRVNAANDKYKET